MNYSRSYEILNRLFNQKDPEILINEAGIVIKNFSFHSRTFDSASISLKKEEGTNVPFLGVPDEEVDVNNHFRYSVFLKKGDTKKHRNVIVMLHGLNERKWNKYLPWAASMLEKTGVPVVLFPISFHMNRSPEAWSDPRLLSPIVKEMILNGKADETTTIVNYALSERLKEMPERFFLSGYQSISDVVTLIKTWKNGNEPIFHPEVRVDFFSYSIGAFLTEVLMIANPEQLLNDSRFFFFCGGSLFSGMNAASKYILNKTSFERIHNFYVNDFEREYVQNGMYKDLLSHDAFGKAFRSMLAPDRFRQLRATTFTRFAKNIKAIGLRKDTVVPSGSILEALRGIDAQTGPGFEEMDFQYPYSHENPFDVKLTKFSGQIDECFENLMGKASHFLAAE